MNSYLKNIIATTVGTFCLMILTQATVAQSGSRNITNQLPQASSSQAVQRTYRTQQGSGQRTETLPDQAQQPQRREPVRLGFEQYDHRALDSLLQKYVDRRGDVDYQTWQTNTQDRSTLLNYLRGMNSVDPSIRSSRQSEMAFWINAYNALTIEGILQLFPTRSIKDHAPNASGYNIWDDFKLPVGGSEYSLNDIEHKVLRKMGDPRIHFAIVCASKGCPQLSQRAYFSESLEQQLVHSAELLFRTPEKFSFDLQRGQLGLSPIIQWFGEDFGRTDQERLQYLSQFMPADAARLATSGSSASSYLDYDWNLNLAPARDVVPVQSFRPQGSATRQPSPQNSAQQGSTTREQFETFRPAQPQRAQHGCAKHSCGSQAAVAGR